jgi:hypothetical protein
MHPEEYEIEDSPVEKGPKKEVSEKRKLIQLTLYCRDKPITAIIDTGSQLNVVRKDIADAQIRLPIDISREITMNDVNGHSKVLNGMINSVPLRCGNVMTEATDMFVGRTLPCELLLGRPWQRGNYVTIDEREAGTYLIFKDHRTLEPRYEIFIAPEDLVPEPVRTRKRAKVYTAMENIQYENNLKPTKICETEVESELVKEATLPQKKCVIAYGPYPTPGQRIQFKNFDYHIFLHFIDHQNSSELCFAYGNPPYHAIKTIPIIPSPRYINYIKRLRNDQVELLVNIVQFVLEKQEQSEKRSMPIPYANLRSPVFHPVSELAKKIFHVYDTYEYPEIEELICLATILIHEPQGELANQFRLSYPQVATELFSGLYIKEDIFTSEEPQKQQEEISISNKTLRCNGEPISAIIDSGSQVNVISLDKAQQFQLLKEHFTVTKEMKNHLLESL